MANPRLTSILIGFLILGLMMTAIAVLFADMNSFSDDYSSYNTSGFNRTKLDRYNKLTEIKNLTEDMREDVQDANPGTGSENDVIGSFFSNSYTAVKTFFKSATYGYELTQAAQEDLSDTVANSELLTTTRTVINIILVVIFIGIGLFIIFKVVV